MVKIEVTQAFTLTRPDGSKERFAPGVQEVDEQTAAHWYVKAHSKPVEAKPAAKPQQQQKPTDPPKGDKPGTSGTESK